MLNSVSKSGLITIAQDTTVTIGCDPNAITHQITLKAGTATAGTLTVTATPIDAGAAETVYYNGSALAQNLATTAQMSYTIDGMFDSITFALSGSNGTAKVSKGDA
jgi:hypothetical protein